MIFNIFAVRNYARYSDAVLPKPGGAKHDWEILTQLGERLAAKLGVAPKPAPSPEMMLDFGLHMRPWGMATEAQLSLAKLKANPSGVDLGPLTPSFPERLYTADKKIHLLPEPVKASIDAARAELLATPAAGQLLLIGRRHVRSNNSWMHNSHRLTKGPQRTALLMHPDDLAQRQLFDGQPVRVTSRVGSVDIEVCASADMMPGTVSLPHGWGHHRPGARLSVARNIPGASINDLTDDQMLDPVCGVAALNGVPVRVEALN